MLFAKIVEMCESYFEDSELYLSHRERAYKHPQSIQIELVNFCNLRCVMCPLTVMGRKNSKYKWFSLEDLKNMRKDFEHVYEVEIAGYGEAFLHPQIIEILRFFKRRGLCVWVTTNGLLLSADKVEAIVSEGLVDVLEVSIDAAKPETYEYIRCGGNFSKLLSNLRYLVELKHKNSKALPSLRFLFLPMKLNVNELPEFCKMAHDMGADLVKIQGMYISRTVPAARELMLTREDLSKVRRAFHRAKSVATELKIPLEFCWHHFSMDDVGMNVDGFVVKSYQFVTPEEQNRPYVKDCSYLWSKCFIRANRDVQICATLWDLGIVGNLEKESLQKIWNSRRYAEIRRRVASTKPITECYECANQSSLRPHLLSELPNKLDFGNPRTTLLGLGFYPPEIDETGRTYRWIRKEATFFLKREAQHALLKLELAVHPVWLNISGLVYLNGRKIGNFRWSDARCGEVSFRLPLEPIGPVAFTICFNREASPVELGVGNDYRKLSVRLYRAELIFTEQRSKR